MFDSYRFAAPDDLDDFGYEDETMDVQAEVSEYGPEDEDEDDLITPAPEPAPLAAPPPRSSIRGAARQETG